MFVTLARRDHPYAPARGPTPRDFAVVHCPTVPARFALFVAPTDPLMSTAPARLEALGWLRNQLVGRGFQVAIVGSGSDPLESLRRAAENLSPGDSVFVHVSGRLVGSDSIAMTGTTQLALPALTELFAARDPGYVSLVLDLVHDEPPGAPREAEPATDLASEVARSLGAADHGYSVLAAVRPLADASDRIAFTRLAMPPVDDGGPPSTEALLSAMHDRAVAAHASDASGAGAQSFSWLRGSTDPTIDGQIEQATAACDWPRVVEMRLDRAETLATVAQRALELTGVARILQVHLRDADGAVDVLEHARALDPKRATVLEALRGAYEASGRAAPIDPADYTKAFAAHRRAGQTDAALLDAMLLEELGVAEPEHVAVVEQSRSVGPMQVLMPLDAAALNALRAPGFDEAVAALLAAVHDAAVAVRLEQVQSSRRVPSLDSAARLDAESTVSAVRTLHWAARVLGVGCPEVYAGTGDLTDASEAVMHVLREPPSIALAPHVLSGTSAKQLAFLAGRALTWYRLEYHCLLYYPRLEDLRELVETALEIAGFDGRATDPSTPSTVETVEMRRALARHLGENERAAIGEAAARLGARGGELGLEHWIRSAELTAARVGLFLCGELKTAVAAVRSQPPAPERPSAERVASDLMAFCASRAHAELRAQFLRLPSQSVAPASGA